MSDLDFTPHETELNLAATPGPTQSAPDPQEPVELFQSFSQPVAAAPTRIPHLGHLLLLAALLGLGWLCTMAGIAVAVHYHLDGVRTLDQVQTNVRYLLGSEAAIYLVALAGCFLIFPLFWDKSFFAGIQWRGAEVLRLNWQLPITATACFALAMFDEFLLPGPANAPIDEVFRTPSAAWLMFAFGVTFAPVMEEIVFRGFLLPALATAWDWAEERPAHKLPRPLDANGHPEWSLPAMVAASIATSLPFALMHGFQTGYSLGPFLLLFVISMVLCAVRLKTRSLAASVAVHSCYNFLLFLFMLAGTEGFRHMGKM